ncbi:MAG: hypothetical protein KAX39_08525 [candidate division Zixibacteria bacterium]|nr:hypothetical protein [candidate division Zixibacteria bacterium]
MPAFIKILLSSLLICLSQPDTVFVTDNLTGLLPDTVEGWDKSETPELYNRKNLFDYINGGAELYLAYDFHQLLVQRYVPEFEDSLGEKSITVEIWQMNSSADAYGIFSFDQEGDEIKMGQGGVYSDGFLRFWKDKFFVRILGLGKDLKEINLKLGSQIDKKIKKEGKPPELVSNIPSDSLISGSIHFFHRQIILKNLYFFSDQNVLNLDRETDCLLADFRMDKYRLKLLLIQYPDTTKAKEAQENLNRFYSKDKSSAEDKIFETKEKKLLGVDLEGNYLIVVFEGRDEKNILWLLDSTKSSLNRDEQ